MLKYGGKGLTQLRQLAGKYGRVAVGVHLTVSGLCFTGCYAAILSSVDVESMLERVGLGSWLPPHDPSPPPSAPASLPGGPPGTPGAHPAPEGPRGGALGGFSAGSAAQMHGLHGLPGVAGEPRQAEGGAAVHQAADDRASSGVVAGAGGVGGQGGEGVGEEKGQWNLVKGGGAFAMAWLCNKALFPVRLPITIGLTPPVWRFLVSKGFRV